MDDPLSGLLDLSRRSREPLTRELASHLRALIGSQRLRAGQRLPSSRTMARALKISRNTVTLAIEQLAAEGYLSVARGRRPRVAESLSLVTARPKREAKSPAVALKTSSLKMSSWARSLPHSNWPPVYPERPRAFQPGLADEREFPHAIWARCLRRAANHALRQSDRGPNDPRLQQALLRHVAEHRGIRARSEQVIIVPTAQSAIALIAKVMIEAGDIAWIESPGYGGALAALRAAGADVKGMPIDADGLKIHARRQAPRQVSAAASEEAAADFRHPVAPISERRFDADRPAARTASVRKREPRRDRRGRLRRRVSL